MKMATRPWSKWKLLLHSSPAEGQVSRGHIQKKTHAMCATFLDSFCLHLFWTLQERGCWGRWTFGPNHYSSDLMLARQVREGLQKVTSLLSSSSALTSNAWTICPGAWDLQACLNTNLKQDWEMKLMECFPKNPSSHKTLQPHHLCSGHPWCSTSHNCFVRSDSRHNLLFLLLHHPWGHMVLTVTQPWLLLLWTEGVVSDTLRSRIQTHLWSCHLSSARSLHHETSPHQPGNPTHPVPRQTTAKKQPRRGYH